MLIIVKIKIPRQMIILDKMVLSYVNKAHEVIKRDNNEALANVLMVKSFDRKTSHLA